MNDLSETLRQELWASLHGELDESRRQDLQRILADHPEARRALSRARMLDRLLKSDLPGLAPAPLSEEDLTDRLLAAMDREQASAPMIRPVLAKAALPSFRAPVGRPAWMVVVRPAAAAVGLAAATAMVMLLVKPLSGNRHGEATWASPTLVPLVYRGVEAPKSWQHVDASAARQCQEALRSALDASLKERGADLPAGVTLALTLRELPDGAFSAQMRAEDGKGSVRGEWSGTYSGVQAFLDQVDSSAAVIADELAPSVATGEVRP